MFSSLIVRQRCLFVQITRCKSNFPKEVPQFSSAIGLEKVYPSSKLDGESIPEAPKNDIKFSGYIPIKALSVTYSRSSGPGGQHVNKTNSKVQVSFHLASAEWIPKEIRQKLLEIHKNSITKDGMWCVKSEKTRSQALNQADCVDKLRSYITEANIIVPVPDFEILEEKRQKAGKAAAARLRDKRMHSMRKQSKNADL